MILKHLTVEVYGSDRAPVGVIAHRDLDIHVIARYCDVGEFTVKLTSNHPLASVLSQPGAGVLVSYKGQTFLSGPMEHSELEDKFNGAGLWTISGPCDNVILADMVDVPGANVGWQDVNTNVGQAQSGTPYQVMARLAGHNAWRRGVDSDPYQPDPELYVEYGKPSTSFFFIPQPEYGSDPLPSGTWPGSNNTVSHTPEFETILEMSQRMVELGSAPFEVRHGHVDVPEYTGYRPVMRPQAFTPGDGGVRFDMRTVGGIETSGSQTAAPTVTSVFIGGAGQGKRRTYAKVTQDYAPLEELWGRKIERFEDRRSEASESELVKAGREALEEGARTQVAQTIELTDDTRYEWGKDFTLGTAVRLVEGDTEREAHIRAIALMADADGVRVGIEVGDRTDEIESIKRRISHLERTESTPPAWVDLTVQNGWEVFPFNQPQYRVNHGELQLRGGVANGPTGVACVTLPTNFRPVQNKYIITRAGNGGIASVTIGTTGVVNIDAYASGGDNSFVGLEAVRFHLN